MKGWINYLAAHHSEPGHSAHCECWEHLRIRGQRSWLHLAKAPGWAFFPISTGQSHSATTGEDEYPSPGEPRRGKAHKGTQEFKPGGGGEMQGGL